MKKLIIGMALITCVIIGCTTASQRTAFTTIASVDAAAKAAFDGYATAVAKGYTTTNNLPQVANYYNEVETACQAAALTSEAGTNALSSAVLTADLQALLNIIAANVPVTTTSTNK